MNDESDNDAEVYEADGILVTEIHCTSPECGRKFVVEGNCDREIIECPFCEALLRVKVK